MPSTSGGSEVRSGSASRSIPVHPMIVGPVARRYNVDKAEEMLRNVSDRDSVVGHGWMAVEVG